MIESQTNNNSALQEIPFDGQSVQAEGDGKSYRVVVRRICENLGVDYSTQLQRLKNQPWAVVGNCPTTGADGKTYTMAVVDRRTLIMWLATIDTNRLPEEKRARIIDYQNKVADVLDAYFGGQVDQAASKADSDMLILSRAVLISDRKIKELTEKTGAQSERIALLEPKAQLADDLTDKSQLISLKQAADLLNNKHHIHIGRTRLIRYMLQTHMLMREAGRLAPTAHAIDAGWMRTKAYTTAGIDKEGNLVPFSPKPMLTGKGLAHLYKRLVPTCDSEAERVAAQDMKEAA